MYTHEQNENSPTKIKYSRLIQQKKEIKNYIYQLRTNWKTKLKCQVRNKGMKTK